MSPEASLSLDTITDEPLRFDFELPFTLEALDRDVLVSIEPARIGGEVSRVEGGYSLGARLALPDRGVLESLHAICGRTFDYITSAGCEFTLPATHLQYTSPQWT